MEAALAVIIIIVSIFVSAMGKTKKKPVRRPPAPVQSYAVKQEEMHPAASAGEEPEEEETEEEEAEEEAEEEELPESDLAIPEQENGSSRECEHGSVGGSMDITTHEGGTDFEHATVKVKAHVRPELRRDDENTVINTVRRLNAEDMRRAVVVSEILKRPEERMRERRWR